MAKHTAKILKSTVIYEGKVFGVRRDEVAEPNGLRAIREVITHPGSVVVLPVLQNERFVMIRQYRHATGQYLWELVAGRIDSGETVKKAAARELLEERMYIVLAEGLTEGKAQPEEDEKIEVRIFGAKKLKQMMQDGRLRDAKTIAALLYYFTFLR